MYEVKILDKAKPIILLKWAGIVNYSEVEKATTALLDAYKEVGMRDYYFLVDASELKVFAPDTKLAIIEQQKIVLPNMIKVASVIQKTIISNQLRETREQSGNNKETQFTTYEKALEFLHNQERGE